jgi:hypothetical protein
MNGSIGFLPARCALLSMGLDLSREAVRLSSLRSRCRGGREVYGSTRAAEAGAVRRRRVESVTEEAGLRV